MCFIILVGDFMRILIVEDEFNLADVLASRLKKENYSVDISLDGEDGCYKALSGAYDLVILDVMLPFMNGFEILDKVRNSGVNCKVIMLTAKSSLDDKLNGFSSGANDYITKPFHIDEVIARVNAQLKSSFSKDNIIKYGDLELDLTKSKIFCVKSGRSVSLVCKEFLILEYFMNNPLVVLSKEQIYNKVWGIENEIESNNLEAYLSFLRKKLKAISSCVNIKSVRGLGYKLEENV